MITCSSVDMNLEPQASQHPVSYTYGSKYYVRHISHLVIIHHYRLSDCVIHNVVAMATLIVGVCVLCTTRITVENLLSELIGAASHSDMQKIRII
jgi:hypothetical protein